VRRYVLNSAVVTAPGLYRYEPLTREQGRLWWEAGPVLSTIGYPEAAAALSDLLQTEVDFNRITISMEPSDEALVFRVVPPPGSRRLDPYNPYQVRSVVAERRFELAILPRWNMPASRWGTPATTMTSRIFWPSPAAGDGRSALAALGQIAPRNSERESKTDLKRRAGLALGLSFSTNSRTP
jgi:hypothetical protein